MKTGWSSLTWINIRPEFNWSDNRDTIYEDAIDEMMVLITERDLTVLLVSNNRLLRDRVQIEIQRRKK